MQNHQLSWLQLPRTRRGNFFAARLQAIKVFLVASLDTQWLAGFLDTSLEGVTVVYTVQNNFSFKSPDSILSPKISLIMAVFAAQVEPACKTYPIQAYLLPSKVPQLKRSLKSTQLIFWQPARWLYLSYYDHMIWIWSSHQPTQLIFDSLLDGYAAPFMFMHFPSRHLALTSGKPQKGRQGAASCYKICTK